jgi:hypothetical protein
MQEPLGYMETTYTVEREGEREREREIWQDWNT